VTVVHIQQSHNSDDVDVCGACLRIPRVWVLLIPCSHMCCVPCALVFQGTDAGVCYNCRTPCTMELPRIQRLPLGYGYDGQECETLYKWYASKRKQRSIMTHALSLFNYIDRYTTEKRLMARRYLLDKNKDQYMDSISRQAALQVKKIYSCKIKECSLCKNKHPILKIQCCLLPLCKECAIIYKRVEAYLPERLDRCPICASYRPMVLSIKPQAKRPPVCNTIIQQKLVWGS
jgi:hypothetical protein